MWEQGGYDTSSGGGGGFMAHSAGGSDTPNRGDKKKTRAQNIVPVHVSDIINMGDQAENFTVEGRDVGMVVIVAQVKTVDHQATKSVYTVQDDKDGAQISAVHWVEDTSDTSTSEICEDVYVRIIGGVRTSQDTKNIIVFKIRPVKNDDEIKAHPTDVEYSRLCIRQLKDKENVSIGGNSLLPNSMLGGGAARNPAMNIGAVDDRVTVYGNAKQNMVHKMISSCPREEGLSRDELKQGLKGKLTPVEIDSAVDYLSSEGHIYSTIDDDHFKAIDG